MKSVIKTLLSVFIFVLLSNPSYSQINDSTKNNFILLNLGLGGGSSIATGSIQSFFIASAGISVSYKMNNKLISIRQLWNIETSIWSNGKRHETGIMYGFYHNEDDYITSISIGVGIVRYNYYEYVSQPTYSFFGTGVTRQVRQEIDDIVLGIPIEAQINFTKGKIARFSLSGFANINTKAPILGGLICLQLGKHR